jgi:hypothetical protein
MARTKVKAFPNPKSLAEIYQATGMFFAFVASPKSKDGRIQCHEWAKCRDFLPDAARAMLTKGKCAIWGFNYKYGKNPDIDMNKMRMLVTKKGMKSKKEVDDFREKMEHGLIMVNHYEKMAKISLTKMYEVDHEKAQGKFDAVYMFYGSGVWMKSPFFISMYTFLIRLGDKKLKFKTNAELRKALKNLNEEYKAGKWRTNQGSDNDANYIGASWDKLDLIMKNRKKLFPEKDGFHDIYFKDYTIGQFHNNTGVLALAKGSTPDQELNKVAKEVLKNG